MSPLRDNLSDDELKANAADAAMSAYLLGYPNNTLWDYFKIEHRQKKGAVDFTANTVIYLAQDIADAVKIDRKYLRDPLLSVSNKQLPFFKTFGANLKSLLTLFKKDPKDTAENMAGGLLLHITHHPEEFTAEMTLTTVPVLRVIHGLLAGVQAVLEE
ncbi:hypothetical protein GN958_ATG17551 [Phytophthora infestans]|uniref:Uncharacterized protein n=1 Tax=Phytophthora infestans TaxID=4787 RepID=A0A8S9U4W6_PHYIN|nr:hypothetical protein GN958_ATG17551 [Phytophthora infestans]